MSLLPELVYFDNTRISLGYCTFDTVYRPIMHGLHCEMHFSGTKLNANNAHMRQVGLFVVLLPSVG